LSSIININFDQINKEQYTNFIKYIIDKINEQKIYKNTKIDYAKEITKYTEYINNNNNIDIYTNLNTITNTTNNVTFHDTNVKITDRFQILFDTNIILYNEIKELYNSVNEPLNSIQFDFFKNNKIKNINNCKDEFLLYLTYHKNIFINYNNYFNSIQKFYRNFQISKIYIEKYNTTLIIENLNDVVIEYFYYNTDKYKIANGKIMYEFKDLITFNYDINSTTAVVQQNIILITIIKLYYSNHNKNLLNIFNVLFNKNKIDITNEYYINFILNIIYQNELQNYIMLYIINKQINNKYNLNTEEGRNTLLNISNKNNDDDDDDIDYNNIIIDEDELFNYVLKLYCHDVDKCKDKIYIFDNYSTEFNKIFKNTDFVNMFNNYSGKIKHLFTNTILQSNFTTIEHTDLTDKNESELDNVDDPDNPLLLPTLPHS
jgi:hypothetical protein